MPNLKPKLLLLPPLKPKPKLMLTTDTVDTMAVDTDTTEARGLLMPPPKLPLLPPLKPKLMPMLTTDTVDTMAVDTVDTVDTTAVDTDTADTDTAVDTDIMVKLLLKQTNPLNYNCQDQVTRNSFNLATMQKFPPPLFFLNMKIPSFFQLNSNPNLMFTI